MADANQAADELARALAKVQQELADFGRTTQQTQDEVKDAQMKAKYGVENYTKATNKGAEAVMALASAGMAAGKAMYDGKKGAAAFNESLDEMSKAATAAGVALALLIPGGFIIKGLIAGITAATTAFIKYEQAANEMADKLSKGYQGLSKAGGAAADGMTGVFKDAKKLGLSMNELDQMVSLVAENSKDFALFAGSVSEGRKRFADLGEAMKPARLEFMNMGMNMEEINAASAGYIKLQSRVGATQNKSVQELAESTKKYLYEQDALTKLTGMTRQDQEKSREEIRSQERFAAKLEEVRQTRGEAAAKALEDTYLILKSKSREAAQGFADLSTGMITTEAARKQNMTDQGASLEQSRRIIDGQQTSAGAAQEIAKVSGETAKRFGTSLALMGANNNVMSDYAGSLALGAAAAGDGIAKAAEKIKKDQEKQAGGADKITDQQNRLILTQMDANAELEKTVFEHIPAAQRHMQTLADAALAAAKALYNLAHDHGPGAEKIMTNEPLTNDQGMDFGQMSGADGGVFKGPQSGYPVLMHGTEAIIPMDKLTNASKMSGLDQFGAFNKSASVVTDNQGLENADADKMEKFAKSMLKDTESLTKITDTDLKRTKNFSLLQTKLFDKKTILMEDELELLDEQNEILEQMLTIAEQAGGKDAASALKKQFTMARMGMGGMGGGSGLQMPTAGSGQGMQMPTATPASGMGGGGGLQAKNQDDLKGLGLKLKSGDVHAEGAGISPKLIELAKAVQAGVPGFGQFTGFNDKFHNEKAPGSQHTKGLAMDFTTAQAPSIEDGKKVTDWLKQMGASLAIDEYNNPSSGATAGHYHAQIPAFKDGGLVDEATLSLIGEGGPEAVIPLKDGQVPVSFNGKMGLGDEAMGLFKVMAEQTTTMAAMMEEMIRAQKDSVDVQNKMLRAQS